jgi:ABC-type uncharacterized transport system substrate-binding protein
MKKNSYIGISFIVLLFGIWTVKELTERLKIAGIEVLEARISSLAYAAEIAGAMLQRQQAIAIVAARQKIVEGAVGMVETALEQLSEKNLCLSVSDFNFINSPFPKTHKPQIEHIKMI